MAGSKTRDARELAIALSATTGVPVELRWDTSTGSRARARGWAWHVDWADGPTVTAMRVHAEREITERRLAAITAGDLVYARILLATSFAIVMVRNVRLGQRPLGGHDNLWRLHEELEETDYPEQGSPEDIEVARVLAGLADHHEHEMPAVLIRYGLAGLHAQVDPPTNVLPFRRRRHQ